MPLNAIKIDRSFIRDVAQDSDNGAIVRAIISLAAALGMDAVAEGVETATEEAFLRSAGCGIAQGYRYARPQPAPEYLSWVMRYSGEMELADG